MKRSLRITVLILLAMAMLTVTALADMGPKPQLTIRVENAPEELYYLDILAEGNYADDENPFDGLEWSYSDEEIAALDQELLEALRAAVPEGWHACTAQGSTGAPMWGDLYPDEDGLHTFGYHGVPETYRVLMVTKSGEVFLSEVCTRTALQSSAAVDWAAKCVTVPSISAAYATQFLATFVPTLLMEGILLALFGLWNRKNVLVFLLVNLVTQGGLTVYFGISAVRYGVSGGYRFLLAAAELAILFAEYLLYRRFLTGRTQERIAAYAVTANVCSAILGFILAEPVWRFVVSIS